MSLVGDKKLHQVGAATAVDCVPLDLSSADVDLTDPAGPTGGKSARALLIGGTGGDIVVETLVGDASRTITLPANFEFRCMVCKIYKTGTTATPIYALL